MEQCGESENAESTVDGLMLSFFSLLWQDAKKENYVMLNRTDNNYPQQPVGLDNRDFTTALHHYIQTHLHEHLTVENVARKLFISRAQFTRRMRQETGRTFVEYVTAYRIEEAKRLLIDTKWTASTIAEMTGFKTAKYFYRVFRKHTGTSPTVFRKQ